MRRCRSIFLIESARTYRCARGVKRCHRGVKKKKKGVPEVRRRCQPRCARGAPEVSSIGGRCTRGVTNNEVSRTGYTSVSCRVIHTVASGRVRCLRPAKPQQGRMAAPAGVARPHWMWSDLLERSARLASTHGPRGARFCRLWPDAPETPPKQVRRCACARQPRGAAGPPLLQHVWHDHGPRVQ